MSIDSELTRIETAKSNLTTALIGKGQSVGANDTIDTFAVKVNAIADADAIIDGTVTDLTSNAVVVKKYKFYQSDYLTSVNLPSAQSIEQEAFAYSAIQNINMPNVINLYQGAFKDCDNLASVILPSCNNIMSDVFADCDNLSSITFGYNGVFTVDPSAIPASASQHITIYVPSNLITAWQTDSDLTSLYNAGYIDFQAISE